MAIYGGASYQMGADEAVVQAAANAPITASQAQAGKVALAKMKRSLKAWLKYRAMNDQIAAGSASTIPTPLFRTPGAAPPPPAVMGLRLRRERFADESELAAQLHSLLSEVFDGGTLPDPDVQKNPNAAVELARIAIAGRLPGDADVMPTAQGFFWLWPLVIVVGAIAFVITTAITSSADVAKEKERIECIKAGKCTDTGFWLKVGSIALVGWIVWDKMGVGARVKRAVKGRSR
jgi:hypothetical protein